MKNEQEDLKKNQTKLLPMENIFIKMRKSERAGQIAQIPKIHVKN